MEPATQQEFCKETDSRGLGKTERIAQADLYSLVFFLDIQTFYQVLFAQVYSVRLTPIYLFLAIRQFCKYDEDLCVKSEKFLSQQTYLPRTYRCLVFALP